MATVRNTQIQAKLTVTLELDEAEVQALDGIFGYDVNHFLKVFYERMGRAYVEPYEAGVRSLHQTIRGVLNEPLRKFNTARRGMIEAMKPPTQA